MKTLLKLIAFSIAMVCLTSRAFPQVIYPCGVYYKELNGTTDYSEWSKVYPTVDYTLAAWVQITDATWQGKEMDIFQRQVRGGFSNDDGLDLYIAADGNFKFRVYTLYDGFPGLDSLNSGVKPDPSKWYHVAVTFQSSGACKMYINGTLAASKSFGNGGMSLHFPYSNYLNVGGKTISLGSLNNTTFATFKGHLDELVVASKALTQDQIRTLANGLFAGDLFLTANNVDSYDKEDNTANVNFGIGGGSVAVAGILHTCPVGSFEFYHFYDHNTKHRDSFGANDIKVAADSSSETLVKIIIPNAEQYTLRVQEDPGSNNKKDYGYFLPYKFYADSILFVYHHPSNPNLGNQYGRTIHFEVYNSTDGLVKLINPVEVVRPPLLLAHGVFGASEMTFGKMRRKLIADNLYLSGQVFAIDYPNDKHFETGVNALRIEKNRALQQALIGNKILCSKFDVAGHSMGGLILRKYLHSKEYDNDINKYISINTPHSGSQIANFAIKYFSWLNPVLGVIGKDLKAGALNDMTVKGPEIKFLNALPSYENKVPSHVIETTQTLSSALENVPVIPHPLWLIALLGTKAYGYPYWEQLYENQPNDLVVEGISQRGGLDSPYYSIIKNQSHGSTSDPNIDVYNEVVRLLNTDPDDEATFTREGFKPPVLTLPDDLKRPIQVDSSNVNLKITSPTLGSDFQTNSTITVNLSYASIDSLVLIMGSLTNPLKVYSINSPTNSINVPVPKEYFGNTQILIVGFNKNGYAAMDSVKIKVSTSAVLDSIFSNPQSITVIRTHNTLINTYGYYTDSVTRNLTGASGLTFKFKTNKASFNASNEILGLANGYDTLTISYSGKSTVIPIQILDSTEWISSEEFVLPIRLTSFTGYLNSRQIFLNWASANEFNSSHFDIERSTDGNNYYKIGNINSIGSSVIANKYQYIDNQLPAASVIFYRLKMIDKDRKFTYSNVIVIKIGEPNNLFRIFPNPANEILYVQASGYNDIATLQVYDASGRKLKEEKVVLNGNTSYSIKIKDLPKGVYNLVLKSKTINEHQKFVKQ